jgi:hypothetical protein
VPGRGRRAAVPSGCGARGRQQRQGEQRRHPAPARRTSRRRRAPRCVHAGPLGPGRRWDRQGSGQNMRRVLLPAPNTPSPPPTLLPEHGRGRQTTERRRPSRSDRSRAPGRLRCRKRAPASAVTEALTEAGIAGSIGPVADALDCESTIGLYMAELIDRQCWTGRNGVERETAAWVHRFNTERLHSGDRLPTTRRVREHFPRHHRHAGPRRGLNPASVRPGRFTHQDSPFTDGEERHRCRLGPCACGGNSTAWRGPTARSRSRGP